MAKSKQEKYYASDINNARNKLDGVLQTLMIKSEDSLELSENDSVKTSPEINVNNDVVSSNSCAKKASASKPPRKRRRKDDTSNSNHGSYHHSYVMKLYDRSVDLARFNDDAPLYPICRAWMHNQPQKGNKAKSRSPSPELEPAATPVTADDDNDELKSYDITFLPPTAPLDIETLDKIKELRTPLPIHLTDEFHNIFQPGGENYQSREDLLAKHLVRWKTVRQRWKMAAFLNETHSRESLTLIKSLFER